MACPAQQPQQEWVCFSDIDGTLVHYLDEPGQLSEVMGEVLLLPQSSTGKTGIISKRSLQQAAALRNRHERGLARCRFVIISGARTATVLQRLPYLPACDALVAENGGRIWYPDPAMAGVTMCPLVEDLEWRQQLAQVAGPPSQDVLPPLERQGLLWDWYRQLHRDGWNLDANSYATCFRLTKTPGRSAAEVDAAIAGRPAGLSCTHNLGVADFYPVASGKEGAASHLLAKWGLAASRSVLLGDDDNDLPLAARVARAFLPSVTSASVEAAVAAQPGRFEVADVRWTGGTEQMLDAVAAYLEQVEAGEAQQAASGSRQQHAIAAS